MEIKNRHCPPTKYDIKPFGSIYKVNSDGKFDYYIQLGQTEDTITWQPMNHIFDVIFGDLYENEEFVEELLKLYQDPYRTIEPLTMFLNNLAK